MHLFVLLFNNLFVRYVVCISVHSFVNVNVNVNVCFFLLFVCLFFYLLARCFLFRFSFVHFFNSFVVFLCVYLFNGSCVVFIFFPSFIYSSICLYVSFLACLFVCHFVGSFARLFICSFIRCLFVYSLSFVCLSFPSYERLCVFLYFLFAFFSLVCLFAGSFSYLLLCAFARSFVFLFNRSFVHPLLHRLFIVFRSSSVFSFVCWFILFFVFYFLQTSVLSCFVFFMFVFSLVCVLAHSFFYLLRSFFFICSFSEEHYLFVMEDPNKTESMSGWDKKQFVNLKL